ncbi:MAG TPA: hypothetical protein VF796_26325, partial [Humisphaera sp.]
MARYRPTAFLIAAALSLPAWAAAGDAAPAAAAAAPVAASAAPSSRDRPLAELPARVPAKDGEVTLFADFASRREFGPVTVYLVNRTGRALSLATQDGAIYLKLEYQTNGGRWRRAEPHVEAICGNSYFTDAVAAGSFRELVGYGPSEGHRATVRYALYQHGLRVASNVAGGFVRPDDVKAAAEDTLALDFASFEVVARLARGEVRWGHPIVGEAGIRDMAIARLGSFP